jgi:hypothetical protein
LTGIILLNNFSSEFYTDGVKFTNLTPFLVAIKFLVAKLHLESIIFIFNAFISNLDFSDSNLRNLYQKMKIFYQYISKG